MKLLRTFVWRRLDQPGHDVCRLYRSPAGWQLCGTALLLENARALDLRYEVRVDARWQTRSARVQGHVGARPVAMAFRRSAGNGWHAGAEQVLPAGPCIDIDLGFTPATNLIALRRLGLRVGQRAEAPAAWLDYRTMRLSVLAQTYHRIDARHYDYAAPSVGYRGTLQVSRIGAVVAYPGLFELL